LPYDYFAFFYCSHFSFEERPHYTDFFHETQKYPKDINILANADIYFNDTLKFLQKIQPGHCYAITRWEEHEGGIIKFEERNAYNKQAKAKHSQDVWVFFGAVRPAIFGRFYIGVPGCDNRIAYEIGRMYIVYNPCETVQCIHKHKDPGRSYTIPDASIKQIPKPWKWVEPCAINDDGRIVLVIPQRKNESNRKTQNSRRAI